MLFRSHGTVIGAQSAVAAVICLKLPSLGHFSQLEPAVAQQNSSPVCTFCLQLYIFVAVLPVAQDITLAGVDPF